MDVKDLLPMNAIELEALRDQMHPALVAVAQKIDPSYLDWRNSSFVCRICGKGPRSLPPDFLPWTRHAMEHMNKLGLWAWI